MTTAAERPAAAGSAADDVVSPLVLAIDETVEAQHRLEQRLRQDFGTNNTDFRALLLVFRLRRAQRTARVADLVRGLGLTSGAASQAAARLKAAGLLQSAPDPSDGRAGALALTSTADDRLAEATRSVREALDGVLHGLGADEERRIIDLLGQVRDVFMEHTRQRDGRD